MCVTIFFVSQIIATMACCGMWVPRAVMFTDMTSNWCVFFSLSIPPTQHGHVGLIRVLLSLSGPRFKIRFLYGPPGLINYNPHQQNQMGTMVVLTGPQMGFKNTFKFCNNYRIYRGHNFLPNHQISKSS